MTNNCETSIIEVRVREIAQLFNSMDPSPFPDRDLDSDAEEFIVGWASEFPVNSPLKVRVHLAQPSTQEHVETYVRDGLRNFFAYKAQLARRRLRSLLGVGRLSLLIGLAFLTMCLGAADLAAHLSDAPVVQIAREGFVIAGWVAMWRPMDIFLYDWWPLRRERRVLERLSHATVEVLTN